MTVIEHLKTVNKTMAFISLCGGCIATGAVAEFSHAWPMQSLLVGLFSYLIYGVITKDIKPKT